MNSVHIFLWIMIGLIIIIAGYLAVIYIMLRISLRKFKNNELIDSRKYPCYINILLTLIIVIDNLVRLIPNGDNSFSCKIQAFILAVFDKLILTTITVNSYLTYKGLSDNDNYMSKIKLLFIIANSVSLLIAIILGLIFVFNGIVEYDNVCYVMGGSFKENIDTVVSLIIFIVFLYCNIKTILLLLKIIKEVFLDKQLIKPHLKHFYRMIIGLFLSSSAFLVTILIINDSLFLNDDYIDLCYIIVCFALNLFYTLNSTIIKQTLILFRCKKESEVYIDQDEIDDDEGENQDNKLNELYERM